ncbi:MAG: hypothetical protein JNL70_15030 [Saprospiraceae bacterium]|nr:hypothetical protein [Saprospiraceae bacterium]
MSDFDKIIHDHLNEDDGEYFPRREANWDKLSARLAEFEATNPLPEQTPAPVLRPVWKRWVWSSAAAALVGVSSLLFWHYNRVQDENKRLQQEIVDLKSAQQTTTLNIDLSKKTEAQTSKTEVATSSNTQTNVATNPLATSEKNKPTDTQSLSVENTTSQSVSAVKNDQKQGQTSSSRQNTAIVDTKMNAPKQGGTNRGDTKEPAIQKKNNSSLTQLQQNKKLDAVPFDKKNEPLKAKKANLNEVLAQQNTPSVSSTNLEANKVKSIETKQGSVSIAPKDEDKNIGNVDKKNLENIEKVEKNTPSVSPTDEGKKEDAKVAQTNTDTKVTESTPAQNATAETVKAKQESESKNLVANQEAKSNAESAATALPIIPVEGFWKRLSKHIQPTLAVGVQGSIASLLPEEIQGVEPTIGKGASVTFMLTKHIGIAANYDLQETRFEVRDRPRRFHVKDEPGPIKPNVALNRIEGERHSRMFSVNAKYVFGQKWWLQPSITVGHSWLEIEKHDVNFVFKDFNTGEETPQKAIAEPERVKNLWQVGVGLEKKIKRWSFGISGEIQKDFSPPTDPMGKTIAANFGILRGGVKFNIF